MSEDLIRDSAERLFARAATQRDFPLWQAVEEAGFPLALLSEDEGGFGLSPAEAIAPLRIASRHGLGLPLAETMLANWLLVRAGKTPKVGRGAVLVDMAHPQLWGRDLDWLLLVDQGRLRVLSRLDLEWAEGRAISGDPFDRLAASPEGGEEISCPLPAVQIRVAMAILRAAQIAGTLEGALTLTLDYAGTRVQFGKTLSKFQAIQQYLAVMAAQTAAARAAADMGAAALSDPEHLLPLGAAAKIRTGEAAGIVADHAHQIHGAIGFSQEYPLHPLTRRLWTLRDLDGSEAEWARLLAGYLSHMPSPRLWPKITELQAGAF